MESAKKLMSLEKAQNSLCRLDYAEAQKNGISYELLETRIRMGWSIKDATTIPKNGKRIVPKGESIYERNYSKFYTHEQKDIAERNGINRHTLKTRIENGWSIEDAITVPVRPKRPAKNKDSKKASGEIIEDKLKPGTVYVVDGKPASNGINIVNVAIVAAVLLFIAQAVNMALILGGR